jgi:diaminopimelate decarboxylase
VGFLHHASLWFCRPCQLHQDPTPTPPLKGRGQGKIYNMHHFQYQDGQLYAEDVRIESIASSVATPFYLYSSATLERHYDVFKESFGSLDTLICYAVKANSNLSVIETLARKGAGADVVSGGELERALRAGVPAGRIVFSGVGKTEAEMATALKAGIFQYNVESEPELLALSAVAQSLNLVAPITFRVNPDVDAKTHAKISTGKAENKFGVPWTKARAIYAEAAKLPGIKISGVDVHIGSQLTNLAPLEQAFVRVVDLVHQLRSDGHSIDRCDFGGGLGIVYEEAQDKPPLPAAYGAMVQRVAGNLGCTLVFEPGRLIVGNAGLLIARVIYVKQGEAKRFIILDAAMNDLVRPAMYDAYHHIAPVEQARAAQMTTATIVGPVCETGDTFATDRQMADVQAGDLVAFHSAGAYGAVMSGSYNTRPLIPEVMVRGSDFAVIRPRVSIADLIALDQKAPWLAA